MTTSKLKFAAYDMAIKFTPILIVFSNYRNLQILHKAIVRKTFFRCTEAYLRSY